MALSYAGRDVVRFADCSYRWVDISSFGLPTDTASDRDAIGLLLAEPRFADSYVGPRDLWRPGNPYHGPYRLERIRVEDYVALGSEDAKAYLGEFVWQPSESPGLTIRGSAIPPSDGRTPRDIESQLASMIDSAQSAYRLRDLGEASYHEFGWTLWFFHELVLLNLTRRTLRLIVAGVD